MNLLNWTYHIFCPRYSALTIDEWNILEEMIDGFRKIREDYRLEITTYHERTILP